MGKRIIIPGADFSANAIGQEPIIVPVEYTLSNGFASRGTNTQIMIDNNESSNLIRVRTSQIRGNCNIKTKSGYVIRAIVMYDTELNITIPNIYNNTNVINVSGVQGLSEYQLTTAEGKWSIVTFCKTNASESISASEDIVDYITYPAE